MQEILKTGRLARLLEVSGRFMADAGHYFAHDRIDLMGRQRKAAAFGNNLDSFSGTVDNHLARLALVQMRFQMGTQFGTGYIVDIVPKFSQEVGAAKHRFSPGE
jgi:hypothetical protein